MSKQNTQLAAASGEVATKNEKKTGSERFTEMVIKQVASLSGDELRVPDSQKRLCQNYFIKIDMVLKENERKRLAKGNNADPLAFDWKNVNMEKLAVDVMAFSSVGLDPTQPNHINPIPYKNNGSNKYDITFMMGYKGLELKASKYGLDVPDAVICELVYSTDIFKQFKKDFKNPIEHYTFEVTNDFDRGEVVGGFWYHQFNNAPQKNKIRVFTKKDIEKRKPKYASAEFWGGEKDAYENGKKVGKEQVEGWYEDMALKTIIRDAYNKITIDPSKIDENYQRMLENEQNDSFKAQIDEEVSENANKKEFTFDEVEVVEEKSQVVIEQTKEKPVQHVSESLQKAQSQMSILDVEPVDNEPPFGE